MANTTTLTIASSPDDLTGVQLKPLLDAVASWSGIKSINWADDGAGDDGRLYAYGVIADDDRTMGAEINYTAAPPVATRVTYLAASDFWALADVDKFRAVRELLDGLYLLGLKTFQLVVTTPG